MEISTIVTMAGIGVGAAVGEKMLNAFGKSDMANFCNIAGLSGLGLTALSIVVKLLQSLTTLAVK